VVEDALAKYDGTLLVVSHDRHFLDNVVNKIAVVANRKVGIFPGNFSQTRTLTRLQEFMGGGEPVPHVVRKSFRDYESGRRFSTGERVLITGGETQTTKRLFRLAIERGWLEPV
jgi:ATP-binding cassette subfamily F protein 3